VGGSRSGRYRTRNQGAVEHALPLDIRQLRRRGYLRPGARLVRDWSWTWAAPSNRPAGAIDFIIDLTAPDGGFVELLFKRNGERQTQRIEIESVPCRYGGRRLYFTCPRTGQRCEVLYGVGGEFASREAHRLTYISQSLGRLSRLHIGRRKAQARALGEEGQPRPRGENREYLTERWSAYLEAIDEECLVGAARWLAKVS
jgi:hypothetical protein